jgi:membrane associated rhomboid family serine protease
LWHLPEGPLPWITFATIALSVVATLLYFTTRDNPHLALYSNGDQIWLRWNWRALLGSGFPHAGPLHLLFNCYWLWIFGRVIESRLGPMRYGLLILVTLWASGVGELAWSGNPGIGMSGVGYGMFGFLSIRRRHDAAFRRILTRGVTGLFWVWLVLCIVIPQGEFMLVANGAHVAGLIAGALFGCALTTGRWSTLARAGGLIVAALSVVPLFWAPWQEGWLAAQVSRAMEQRQFDVALRWCAQIKGARYNEWARSNEANIRQYQASITTHRAELLRLAENSSNANVLNSVAWRLATSVHDHLRDGVKAVVFATRACELDGWKNPAILDTLAAAHAESGNFEEAKKWMLRALENPGEHAATLKKHLDAFRAQRSWREEDAPVAAVK